jgi:segregation and condensation protein A
VSAGTHPAAEGCFPPPPAGAPEPDSGGAPDATATTTMLATANIPQDQLELFSGFSVKIEIFEGPLDLLLYLVRRQEVEIQEVQVSAITDEYIHYLETMTAINVDLASEFVVMAANLLWLKSRQLLPRQEASANDEELEEEFVHSEEELRERLEEYRAYKEAAELLAESRELRQRVFLRALSDGEEIGSGYVPLADVSLFDMLAAVQEMLERTKEVPPAVVRTPELTIPDCIEEIVMRLQATEDRSCRFVDLVDLPTSRIMIVMVFLATLELIRRRRVRVSSSGEARDVMLALVD